MSAPERILLTWLHLSDIHFGHGSASYRWDQQLILETLKNDLVGLARTGLPTPDVIFVTGDIAFSGRAEQYVAAGAWLDAVAQVVQVPPEFVFLVPGNHDIQRDVDACNRGVRRLVERLRSDDEALDDALADPGDRSMLRMRLSHYLDFASRYRASDVEKEETLARDLYWKVVLDGGVCSIRVVGLNTALLCADDRDKGRLRVGSEQLAQTLLPKEDERTLLTIALTHHPVSWLHDERDVSEWFASRVHIHLHGHIHDAESERHQKGGGSDFLRVAAGAVHGDPSGRRHGYSFASVSVNPEGMLNVRVWPRGWSERNKDFRTDVDAVPPGSNCAEHLLSPRLEPETVPQIVPIARRRETIRAVIAAEQGLSSPDPEGSLRDYPPRIDVFVGRERELQRMTDLSVRVLVISGIGGQGKSVLAAVYLKRAELAARHDSWEWRDCREEGNKLQAQLISLISRLTYGQVGGAQLIGADTPYLVKLLFQHLGDRNILFVFDNIDRYVDVEARLPIDGMKVLMEHALRANHNSKFIFTCRPGIEYGDDRFDHIELPGLSVGEAEELFRLKGVDVKDERTKAEVGRVHDLTQGHPLWLTLIATQVARSSARLSDFIRDLARDRASGLPTDMLKSIWESLSDKQQALLRCLAEAVRPETEERLEKYVSDWLNWNQYSRALRTLKTLDLVVVKQPPHSTETLELHPLIKQFVRREYPLQERQQFIVKILGFFNRMIAVFVTQLDKNPSFGILEHWTLKAELAMNGGQYEEALKALEEVEEPILASGYVEEFVRVALRLYYELDWTDAIARDIDYFDSVLSTVSDSLAQLGRFPEVDSLLDKYESSITGKSARYINLCDMRCYSHWLRKDYAPAKKWGWRGVELKSKTNLDTRFDASYNLALAQRDSGEVEEALEFFMEERSLDEVLHSTKAADVGNVGRCLWFKGDDAGALRCFTKAAWLLEREQQQTTPMNRGYAAMWIAEVLTKNQRAEEAYWFFRRARKIWSTISPVKAEEAQASLAELLRQNSQLSRLDETEDRVVDEWCSQWVSAQTQDHV
ncbi:MAG: metallophosphoesterase [Candidatus Rokubacteria bacterium]|nr:metallophosphoesterase [Candidatus Rokubacteria bacterium]